MENINLYVIILDAVYRHNIKGTETDRDRAFTLAAAAIEAEDDDYHDVIVLEVPCGKLVDDGEEVLRLEGIENKVTRAAV